MDWCSYDRLISKRVVVAGDRWAGAPAEGGTAVVSVADLRGDVPADSEYLREGRVTIAVGEYDSVIDRLVERCVRKMFKGETCVVALRGGDTECRLTLVAFDNPAAPLYEWSAEAKVALARRHKESGSLLFKAGRYDAARARFNRAVRLCLFAGLAESEAAALYATACNNLALVRLTLGHPGEAIALCNKVLEVEGDNVKCLLRRAKAEWMTEDAEGARATVERVLALEPSNRAARAILSDARGTITAQNAKDAVLARRMLNLTTG